jgi:antibiotic biosynthesis monooxygenase (ABM) superfamily enzyme
MIWLAVFPTLTLINLALGHWLGTLTPVVRTLVLATIAVPIVIYGVMPQLHRLRRRLLTRNAGSPVGTPQYATTKEGGSP